MSLVAYQHLYAAVQLPCGHRHIPLETSKTYTPPLRAFYFSIPLYQGYSPQLQFRTFISHFCQCKKGNVFHGYSCTFFTPFKATVQNHPRRRHAESPDFLSLQYQLLPLRTPFLPTVKRYDRTDRTRLHTNPYLSNNPPLQTLVYLPLHKTIESPNYQRVKRLVASTPFNSNPHYLTKPLY